jgi:hypothetical protein
MKMSMKGTLIATAVASMFVTGCASQSGSMAKDDKMGGAMVHCGSINSCKGQSSCATASNSCKGQNTCKGQGWVPTASEQECKDKGGAVVAAKM